MSEHRPEHDEGGPWMPEENRTSNPSVTATIAARLRSPYIPDTGTCKIAADLLEAYALKDVEIERLRAELKQYTDWSNPQLERLGREMEANERLRAALTDAERTLKVIADNPGWLDHHARAAGYFKRAADEPAEKEPK